MTRTPITDPRHVAPTERPKHGLPRDNEDIVEEIFAISHELIVPITGDDAAIKRAEEKLAQKNWAERTEWSELGQLSVDGKPSSASSDGSGSTASRTIQIGGNTSISEVRNRGFFNLQAAFERGLKTEFEEERDATKEVIEAATVAAREALAAILPPQAFLFVPPDELFRAQQEAERLAREFAKESLNTQKAPDKDAMSKGGKTGDLKRSLGKKLRGLSLRHDGRMHIYPYSEQYAPETGITPVAKIESRHQSIVGDHGRAQMGTG
ncbi:MAG: hypothetical protein ACOYJ2_02635 [Rickettsiales bacterium]